MLKDWQNNIFRQLSRKISRKNFLPFLFGVTFAVTLILHSLIPVLLVNDPAIAQSKQANQPNQANQPKQLAQPSKQPVFKREEIRGVWLTSNDFSMFSDRKQLGEALQQLKKLNFNTIYPVVWNSGYVMFPSDVAKNADIQPFIYRGNERQDIVADIILQAHQNNLLVMPWFEFGFMAPPTSELAIAHLIGSLKNAMAIKLRLQPRAKLHGSIHSILKSRNFLQSWY